MMRMAWSNPSFNSIPTYTSINIMKNSISIVAEFDFGSYLFEGHALEWRSISEAISI